MTIRKLLAVLISALVLAPALSRAQASPAIVRWVAEAGALAKNAKKLGKKLFETEGQGNQSGLAVRDEQLGKLFQVSAIVVQGDGESAIYGDFSGEWVVRFEKAEDKIELLRKNLHFRAKPGSAEAKMLQRSYSDSLLGRLAVRKPPSDKKGAAKASVIDLKELLVGDLFGVAVAIGESAGAGYRESDSRILDLRVFSGNMEATVRYAFRAVSESPLRADGKSFFVAVHYSLTRMPEDEGYEPREADQRVGYFLTRHQDFSKPALKAVPEPYVHYINRWRLEKSDRSKAVSKVKDPVTFWIDETVPEDLHPVLERGIKAWNAAFEEIGLKGALQVRKVKDLPPRERKAFHAADAARDVVVGVFSSRSAYAIGPSRATPDGRIYHAAVFWSDRFIRALRGEARSEHAKQLKDSLKAWAAYEGEDAHARERGHARRHAEELERWAYRVSSWRSVLRGLGAFTKKDEQAYFEQALQEGTMHETGHVLGLRHNFKASRHAGAGGSLTASVMDYNSVNVPRLDPKTGKPEWKGPFYQTRLGAYDKWAIKYGYLPLEGKTAKERAEALARIADESLKRPELQYGTDEDTGLGDPDAMRYDGPGDPLVYGRTQLELVRRMWAKLAKDAERTRDPASFKDLRSAVFSGGSIYVQTLLQQAEAIGGMHMSRQKAASAEPGAEDAFRPVPRKRQQAVLEFLVSEYLDDEKLKLSPTLIRRMGHDRRGRLGEEYPETWAYDHDANVRSLQRSLVARLLHPRTQANLERSRQYAGPGEKLMTAAAVFEKVDGAVWRGVRRRDKGALSVSVNRQYLQAFHVDRLIGIRKDGEATLEGRRQAKRSLKAIRARIDAALESPLVEPSAREHLKELREKIDRHLTRPVATTADLSVMGRIGFALQAAFS